MKRINSGQEAMEFALISGLVFIVALGAVMLFGNKLAGFFSGGSVAATASHGAPLISTNSNSGGGGGSSDFTPNYETVVEEEAPPTGGEAETKIIDGVEVAYNADGSTSFNVGGQDFNIPAGAIGISGELYETAEALGAAGLEDTIMQAFIQMIKEYQEEHPGEEVPAQIANGDSIRTDIGTIGSSETVAVFGDAQINMVNLKVGDQIVTFVVDQFAEKAKDANGALIKDANGNYVYNVECNEVFMIEGGYVASGELSGDDKFKMWNGQYFNEGFYGTVTSLTNNQEVGKYYQQDYTNADGINIGEGTYLQEGFTNTYDDWTLDFSDASNQYDI